MSVVTTMQRESQALAAYSLYKCLYSSTNYRSATQIIAEYINYVIQVKKTISFYGGGYKSVPFFRISI